MQPARIARVNVRDGWAAIDVLRGLITSDDLGWARRVCRGDLLSAREIHERVAGHVRYLHGDEIQRWATPSRTWAGGYGDCGNLARVTIGLARFRGYPARLRVFQRAWKEPGPLGRFSTQPVHVAAQIWDRGSWRWSETSLAAAYGEHPLDAAARLGLDVRGLVEVPPEGTSVPRKVRAVRPASGRWPWRGYPPSVTVSGRRFERSRTSWPYVGVAAQYREAVPRASLHMRVFRDGRWVVDHMDAVNPDLGSKVEHFARDVVGGLGRARIGAMEVPHTKTPATPEEFYQALTDAWVTARTDTPTRAQLLILLAQWAVETDTGRAMIQWNPGNVKHVPGDGLDWTTYTTTEGTGDAKVTVKQSFKAYPDLASGTAAWFARFQPGGPNAGAWAYVIDADPDGFAQALKSERYYTESEPNYDAALRARLSQLEALDLPDPSPSSGLGPALAVAALAGMGLWLASSQGWISLPSWESVTRWL